MKKYENKQVEGKIAMPKIGCGLDKLEWSRVRKIIFQLFKNMNVEILVCSLK